LQNDVRSAVCQYCTFVEGNNQAAQKVRIWEAAHNKERHPAITRAVEICREALVREGGILDMQGFLEPSHAKLRKVLDLIPAEGRKDFEAKLNASPGSWKSRQVWEELCHTLRRHDKMKLIDELTIEFAWPRLDMNVTKQMNHLLKAPFCVHPGTGKVCVPIDVADADTFDPDRVPTVRSIANALAAGQPSPLEPHVRAFKRFIHNHHVEIGTARREATNAALDW
jgi:DNA primase small subunit